jgi:predicted nucleotidyltransferase component of viral defense system
LEDAGKAGQANAERLSALAKRIGQDTAKIQRMFVLERFLARLQAGSHRDLFAVKGGFLMAVYGGGFTRPTEDVDLSRIGDACPEDWIKAVAADVVSTPAPAKEDGVSFDLSCLKAVPITGGGMDFGLKVSFQATIGKSRCKVVLDVCGGNPIVPGPVMREVPSLLPKEFPPVTLPCYPLELVIAEKLHAAEWFGPDNSRVKDFHDVAKLVEMNVVDGAALAEAMKAVWGHWGSVHRTAAEMEAGEGLSDDYAFAMQDRWEGWLSEFRIVGMPTDFAEVVAKVRDFAGPVLDAVAVGEEFPMDWTPEGGWTPKPAWTI